MPRAKKIPTTPERVAFERDIWEMTGGVWDSTLADWDPKPEPFAAFFFEVLGSGEFITFRSGQGGRTLGVQVWNWENKRPYIWFTEPQELDLWIAEMTEKLRAARVHS